MSQIRDAILLAATHMERRPLEFDFEDYRVPSGPGCGTPGCALGWIASFWNAIAGHSFIRYSQMATDPAMALQPEEKKSGVYVEGDKQWYSHEVLGPECGQDDLRVNQFYHRMDALAGTAGWRGSASLCARTLRAYADKYHPASAEDADELMVEMVKAENKRVEELICV